MATDNVQWTLSFDPPTLPPITSTLIQNIIFALRVQNRACGKNEVFSYSKYYSYTPSGAFSVVMQ